jgi:hypothetical protein
MRNIHDGGDILKVGTLNPAFSPDKEEHGPGVGEVAIFRAIRLTVRSGIVIANVRKNWFTPPLPEQ